MSECNDLNLKLISELSKLSCSEDINKQNIAEIIDYFYTIKSAENTTENMTEKTGMPCGLRDDIPQSEYSREDMLRNASHKTDEYICVPKTVE